MADSISSSVLFSSSALLDGPSLLPVDWSQRQLVLRAYHLREFHLLFLSHGEDAADLSELLPLSRPTWDTLDLLSSSSAVSPELGEWSLLSSSSPGWLTESVEGSLWFTEVSRVSPSFFRYPFFDAS